MASNLDLLPQQSSGTPGLSASPLAKLGAAKLPPPPSPSARLAARIATPKGPKLPNPFRQ